MKETTLKKHTHILFCLGYTCTCILAYYFKSLRMLLMIEADLL
jgi:hypothetical protein